jgi:uncharacterized membrane protein YfcA
MSARRRRAAASAVGALVAALICAALAGSVDNDLHRTILLVLALAWLVIAGSSVVNVLRTEPAPAAPEPPAAAEADPHEST